MTSLSDLPLRADLVGRSAYGAPQLQVPVALNVNENTHAVPAEVRDDILQRIAATLLAVNRYPDREFGELRAALANEPDPGLRQVAGMPAAATAITMLDALTETFLAA